MATSWPVDGQLMPADGVARLQVFGQKNTRRSGWEEPVDGARSKKTESSSFVRPCCVTASEWSMGILGARVSQKQSAAVGHSLKRELFGSFLAPVWRFMACAPRAHSEVSVLSDKG